MLVPPFGQSSLRSAARESIFLSASCSLPIDWSRFRSEYLFLHNGPTIPFKRHGLMHTRPAKAARHLYQPEFVYPRPLKTSYQSCLLFTPSTISCSDHLFAQLCTQLRIARMVPPSASAPSLLRPTLAMAIIVRSRQQSRQLSHKMRCRPPI